MMDWGGCDEVSAQWLVRVMNMTRQLNGGKASVRRRYKLCGGGK
jgi:hypothetical protein